MGRTPADEKWPQNAAEPRAWHYLIAFVPPFLALAAPVYMYGKASQRSLGYGANALYVYVILPVLDYCHDLATRTDQVSRTGHGPGSTEQVASRRKTRLLREAPVFRAMILVHSFICLSSLFGVISLILSPSAQAAGATPQSLLEKTLLVFSCGTVIAGGTAGAHELYHRVDRSSRLERFVSWLFMAVTLNPWFMQDHHNHHRHVATYNDPSSARKGESVYHYFWRFNLGTIANASQDANQRIRKTRSASGSEFAAACALLTDPFYGGCLMSVATVLILRATLSMDSLYVVLGFAFWGVVLTSIASYLEHYGLSRRADEPVLPRHSWNNPQVFSNITTWSLGTHSHHHLNSSVIYPDLKMIGGPVHRYGLVGSTLLSLVPLAFFRVTDPLIPVD